MLSKGDILFIATLFVLFLIAWLTVRRKRGISGSRSGAKKR